VFQQHQQEQQQQELMYMLSKAAGRKFDRILSNEVFLTFLFDLVACVKFNETFDNQSNTFFPHGAVSIDTILMKCGVGEKASLAQHSFSQTGQSLGDSQV
jgi:hypothetical protein